jgi:hypothetical protein
MLRQDARSTKYKITQALTFFGTFAPYSGSLDIAFTEVIECENY